MLADAPPPPLRPHRLQMAAWAFRQRLDEVATRARLRLDAALDSVPRGLARMILAHVLTAAISAACMTTCAVLATISRLVSRQHHQSCISGISVTVEVSVFMYRLCTGAPHMLAH